MMISEMTKLFLFFFIFISITSLSFALSNDEYSLLSKTNLDQFSSSDELQLFQLWKPNGRKEMAEAIGIVKHIVIAKFKDDMTQERIDELIKDFANQVNLIPSMKSFHWGRDISTKNMQQGFTHVLESTFDSMEGVAEFAAHPAHVEFVKYFIPSLEKFIIIDYKSTIVDL